MVLVQASPKTRLISCDSLGRGSSSTWWFCDFPWWINGTFPPFQNQCQFYLQRAHSLWKLLLIPPSFPALYKAVNSLITGGLYSNYEFGRFKNLLNYLTVGAKPEWLFQVRPHTFLRLQFIVFQNHSYNLSLLWVGGWSCPCFSSGHQWVVAQLYLDAVDFRNSDSCHLPYWLQWFLIQ